jgi:hypothetical protein
MVGGVLSEAVMIAGGVSAAYLDDDCFPDLIFSGGDSSGMVFYENQAGASFQANDSFLSDDPGRLFTGAAVADLNGDYRREILLANLYNGHVPVYAATDGAQYGPIAELPMARHTYGISFAPLDDSGYPYFYFSHWSGGSGSVGTSPALWKNDGAVIRPWDAQAKTTSTYVDQSFNFTPGFADFTGDGYADLVLASDFSTSQTLVNRPDGSGGFVFANVTGREVISDENGMGATVLDRNNDGVLEWFVTSIWDPDGEAEANWGVTGNRLYENISTDGELAFKDITEEAGVRDGLWGWGACAADFDNDGFIDLFHVNGFGYIPSEVDNGSAKQQYDNLTANQFQGTPPRLFMNNGDGTFTERAEEWDIDVPSEGRGVVCFDYDRDGDMDIAVLDHSSGLQFFENRMGSHDNHFLNVRLVGEFPNTDAIGARVSVTADVGGGHGIQTMLRLSNANSNFNSQNPPDLHFGLGEAVIADQIQVDWPDGSQLVCEDVAVNRFLVLDQRNDQAACPTPP